jgi:chaperonin cofactor prefoldin
MIEKLNLEDVFVMELLVNKINEIIDTVNDLDERLTQRIDNNWKHHRQMSRQIDELKENLEKTLNQIAQTKFEAEKGSI